LQIIGNNLLFKGRIVPLAFKNKDRNLLVENN
jgi:hypothetical protein